MPPRRIAEGPGRRAAAASPPTTPAYAAGAPDPSLIRLPIGAFLDGVAATHESGEALVSCHQRQRYTYGALQGEVERVARGLIASGVGRGDRVGIWSGSCAEWVITQYAVAKIGGILVAINPAYRVDDVEYVLNHAGVAVVIAGARYRDNDQAGALGRLSRVASLRRAVLLGPESSPHALAWAELSARGAAVGAPVLRERAQASSCDDPALVLYTSGTTGRPKGVTLSHLSILNCGASIGRRLRCSPGDRICLPVPLFHCLGCVMGHMAALTHASAVVLPDAGFDAQACLDAIESERCTALYGVPTMFLAQLSHPTFARHRLDSLRTGIIAGAPCPAAVMRQVMDLMHVPEVTICYGMTETPPVTQTYVDDSVDDRVVTVGHPLPHVECRIVDPDSLRVLPRGEVGEICVRGYGVTMGYWNDPAATAALFDPAGWLHTGDLGVMRADGRLVIGGRLKDLIIRGGENIYPREIEEVLLGCRKVRDACVVGLPDAHFGEELCAWIRLHDGEHATALDIRRHCRGRLPTDKIPRYVYFTDAFPTTSTGKVQTFRLREMALTRLAADARAADDGLPPRS